MACVTCCRSAGLGAWCSRLCGSCKGRRRSPVALCEMGKETGWLRAAQPAFGAGIAGFEARESRHRALCCSRWRHGSALSLRTRSSCAGSSAPAASEAGPGSSPRYSFPWFLPDVAATHNTVLQICIGSSFRWCFCRLDLHALSHRAKLRAYRAEA